MISEEMLVFASLAASCECPVLLSGETGAGKTFLAREIHQRSVRAGRPFIRVNCATIPDTLFEREMFGHVRGAFTDAREAGTGFFEAADTGTLFLDEIGEIPVTLQCKLLSVLEEGTFRKLGSPREVRVDVRIIAATNRDLSEMVQQKLFRQDFYYRLSVLQYRVPPLRERNSEIREIVQHLLRRHSSPEPPEISPDALRLLSDYPWPGNIRELENALSAAVIFAAGLPIRLEHLPPDIRARRRSGVTHGAAASAVREAPRYSAPDDSKQEMHEILEAVRAAGGNKTAAARRLGMARSTLWAKLKAYQFLENSFAADTPPEGWSRTV